MSCERVLDLAFRFLEGALDGEERAAVVSHLTECADCRGLLASLREAPPEDPELTTAILRRTAGPVCDAARDRLVSWTDATLGPVDVELVNGHLGRCAECAALGRVLSSMQAELPLFGEAGPDEAFVAAVLARTSMRPRGMPLAERWLASVKSLLDRPRIALEGGFVAASLMMLPFGAFRGHAAPRALGALRCTSAAASAEVSVRTRDAWATMKGFVAGHTAGFHPGTFSAAGASSETSEGTGELDRSPSDQENGR